MITLIIVWVIGCFIFSGIYPNELALAPIWPIYVVMELCQMIYDLFICP